MQEQEKIIGKIIVIHGVYYLNIKKKVAESLTISGGEEVVLEISPSSRISGRGQLTATLEWN